MELAASQGFDVKVVALPPGLDPADAPEAFEAKLAEAEPYLGYRVRIEVERALPNRQEAFVRAREILERFDDSPDFQDALRYLADRLDLPKETQAGSRTAPAVARRRPALRSRLACSKRESGSSATRSRAASPTRAWSGSSPSSGPSTSTPSPRAACATTSSPGRRRPTTSSRCTPSWTRAPPPRGSTRRPPSSCCCGFASAGSSGSCQTADAEHLRDLQIALQKVRTAFREFA